MEENKYIYEKTKYKRIVKGIFIFFTFKCTFSLIGYCEQKVYRLNIFDWWFYFSTFTGIKSLKHLLSDILIESVEKYFSCRKINYHEKMDFIWRKMFDLWLSSGVKTALSSDLNPSKNRSKLKIKTFIKKY